MLDEPAQILDLRIKPKFSYISTEFNFFLQASNGQRKTKLANFLMDHQILKGMEYFLSFY